MAWVKSSEGLDALRTPKNNDHLGDVRCGAWFSLCRQGVESYLDEGWLGFGLFDEFGKTLLRQRRRHFALETPVSTQSVAGIYHIPVRPTGDSAGAPPRDPALLQLAPAGGTVPPRLSARTKRAASAWFSPPFSRWERAPGSRHTRHTPAGPRSQGEPEASAHGVEPGISRNAGPRGLRLPPDGVFGPSGTLSPAHCAPRRRG